ncbi:hypothetical protein [Tritonibacter mobilis]|uniref:hypothetical protein n=1 Tax=Tritonibacter mobilis TaxID=379347 RepID=UPI0008069BCA|nr:hypothetical protein [Tritonibacter mobilis]
MTMVMLGVSLPASAHQFYPHPCGEKRGSPVSVEHVDEFSKDLMMYFTHHQEFVLLSCKSMKAVVVVYPKGDFRQLDTLRNEVTNMQCSDGEMSLEDVQDVFAEDFDKVSIETQGVLGGNPFRCVCAEAAAGGHQRAVWELQSEQLVATNRSLPTVVKCP